MSQITVTADTHSSEAYDNRFQAYEALHRVLSSRRGKDAILKVLRSVALTPGLDSRVAESAYAAIAALGTPDDESSKVIASVVKSVPVPSSSTCLSACSEPSGTTAAILLMCGFVPDDVGWSIAQKFKMIPKQYGIDAQLRDRFVDNIIRLNQLGIQWEDGTLSHCVAKIIEVERWNSSFARKIVQETRLLPPFLSQITIEHAPAAISALAMQKELDNSRQAARLMKFLVLLPDQNTAINILNRFLQDKTIPSQEKITMYEMLMSHQQEISEDDSVMTAAKSTVSNWLASSNDANAFNAVLNQLIEGKDLFCVETLTSNLKFSLNEYAVIIDALRKYKSIHRANTDFLNFVGSMEREIKVPSEDLELPDLLEDDNFLFSFVAPNGKLILMKTGSMSDLKITVITTAILVAIGWPISLALFSTGATPEDVARNPDAVQRGRQIAVSNNPEAKKMVEEAVAKAYTARAHQHHEEYAPAGIQRPISVQPNQNISTKNAPASTNATPEQMHQACEITHDIVNAVIAMERVKGKPFSSKGAGGDMQLMPKTWESINKKHFNGKYPFDKYATHSWINKKFGTLYLKEIKNYLDSHRSQWKTDQLPLIFACYFGGIGNVRKANFDPDKLKQHFPLTYDYMVRGSNLSGYDTSRL